MFKTKMAVLLTVVCAPAFSLPIDWHGTLGFDLNLIDNYRRKNTATVNSLAAGSQEIELGNAQENANWQSYVFRLQPHIVVNDSASIKAELSTGYARGGFVGQNNTLSKASGVANQLYPYNFSSGTNGVVANQLYAELYSDTATYVIGRHPQHFGLGAIVDSGEDFWDRFSFLRDGVTVKVKLGGFKIEPFWTRIGVGDSLTKGTRNKEYGIALSYDNIERDLSFGILYSKKETVNNNSDYQSISTGSLQSLGNTSVKVIDIFVKKSFGELELGLEVPILNGEIGRVLDSNTKYKTGAYIFESKYKLTNSWSIGIDAGKVNGEDGNSSSFEAMYLNPNYQIANLLFRYNLRAIADTNNYNIYDSYINNTLYAKLHGHYTTEKWRWDMAFIWAKAAEVANLGQTSYNHLRNQTFTAQYQQEDDLGFEFDTGFEYKWNSEISIGGQFGYLFTGDYFAYTNSAAKNIVDDSYVLQLRTSISF